MTMLDGRVAIVTGGGQGLGRAHSLELAAQGAAVVIADPGLTLGGEKSDESPADAVVREITEQGGTARAVAISVTDHAGTRDLVDEVVRDLGRLDVVVNNAGITRDRMITSMEEQDWDAVIAVHLKGSWNLTKHAAVHWRAQAKAGTPGSGRIINTTSGSGMRGIVGQSAYSSAKSAIAMLTVVTAMELAAYGVTANAVAPVARTRMTEAAPGVLHGGDDAFDVYAPENTSPLVAYLASERSGWLTGQVLRVDGNKLRFYERWNTSEQVFVPSEARALRTDEVEVGLQALYGVYPLALQDRRLTTWRD